MADFDRDLNIENIDDIDIDDIEIDDELDELSDENDDVYDYDFTDDEEDTDIVDKKVSNIKKDKKKKKKKLDNTSYNQDYSTDNYNDNQENNVYSQNNTIESNTPDYVNNNYSNSDNVSNITNINNDVINNNQVENSSEIPNINNSALNISNINSVNDNENVDIIDRLVNEPDYTVDTENFSEVFSADNVDATNIFETPKMVLSEDVTVTNINDNPFSDENNTNIYNIPQNTTTIEDTLQNIDNSFNAHTVNMDYQSNEVEYNNKINSVIEKAEDFYNKYNDVYDYNTDNQYNYDTSYNTDNQIYQSEYQSEDLYAGSSNRNDDDLVFDRLLNTNNSTATDMFVEDATQSTPFQSEVTPLNIFSTNDDNSVNQYNPFIYDNSNVLSNNSEKIHYQSDNNINSNNYSSSNNDGNNYSSIDYGFNNKSNYTSNTDNNTNTSIPLRSYSNNNQAVINNSNYNSSDNINNNTFINNDTNKNDVSYGYKNENNNTYKNTNNYENNNGPVVNTNINNNRVNDYKTYQDDNKNNQSEIRNNQIINNISNNGIYRTPLNNEYNQKNSDNNYKSTDTEHINNQYIKNNENRRVVNNASEKNISDAYAVTHSPINQRTTINNSTDNINHSNISNNSASNINNYTINPQNIYNGKSYTISDINNYSNRSIVNELNRRNDVRNVSALNISNKENNTTTSRINTINNIEQSSQQPRERAIYISQQSEEKLQQKSGAFNQKNNTVIDQRKNAAQSFRPPGEKKREKENNLTEKVVIDSRNSNNRGAYSVVTNNKEIIVSENQSINTDVNSKEKPKKIFSSDVKSKSGSILSNKKDSYTFNQDQNNIDNNKKLRYKDEKATGKETSETEKEKFGQKAHNFHEFKRQTRTNVANYLNTGGNIAVRGISNAAVSNEGQEGINEFKKYTSPVITTLSIVGLSATASSYKDHIKDFYKANKQVNQLFKNGTLNVSDLNLANKDLKKQLKSIKIDGAKLDSNTIREIIKNKELIHGMYGIRDELNGLLHTANIDPKLIQSLNKNGFFNIDKKSSRKILQSYFNNSTDDVLRNVLGHGRYENMSKKDFKKFIKKFDKNEVSLNGRTAVKIAQMLNRKDKADRLLNSKVRASLGNIINQMFHKTLNMSEEAAEGFRHVQLSYRISKVTSKTAKKVLIGTSKHNYKGITPNTLRLAKKILIGTKKSGYKGLLSIATKQTLSLLRYTDNMIYYGTHGNFSFTKLGYNVSKAVNTRKEVVKVTGKKIATKTANKIANTKVVKKTGKVANKTLEAEKKVANAVKNKAKKIASSKVGKATKIAGKSAGKTVKAMGKPVKFASKATKKVASGIGKAISFVGKIKKFIIITLFCLIAAFMILLVAVDGIIGAFGNTEKTIYTLMIMDDEDDGQTYIRNTIQRMIDKFNSRKDDAEAIGKGTPSNTSVYAEHTIDKYGYPTDSSKTETDAYGHIKDKGNWHYGYKIYYKDSDGNILTNAVNNVKDVMTCTYTYNDGEFYSSQSDNDILFDNVYDELNPDIKDEDCDVSDIYTCDDGCETVYYTCNDSALLDVNNSNSYVTNASIKSDKNSGAKFYSNIVTHTHGDKNVTTCQGHDHGQAVYDANKPEKDCDNYVIYPFDNNKKYLSVCAGHKDSIFTTNHGVKISEKDYEAPDNCDDYSKYTISADGKKFYLTRCNGHKLSLGNSDNNTKKVTYHNASYSIIGSLSGCDNFSTDIDVNKKTITLTCLKTGGITHNHGTRTNNSEDVIAPSNGTSICDNYTTDWYCTGHSIRACYGHRDVSIYIPVKFKEDFFEKHNHVMDDERIEWCNELYNADWYENYGTDPYGGAGFNVAPSFSDEQMQEILNNTGGASTLRLNIISNALLAVGQIPYYYGGKPKNMGYPINTNVGLAGGGATTPDHKGRTIAGLDCFGFCQWVYWTASGSNILPEGSSCSTTQVFNTKQCGNLVNISEAELQVGDLGFQAGHVGIYAGTVDGKKMWIHCNGGANTVSYNAYTKFTRYYRLKGLE